MAAKKPSRNQAERELIEDLRKHPEMLERFQKIMRVVSEPSGDLCVSNC